MQTHPAVRVGFELATDGIQFYVCQLGQDIPLIRHSRLLSVNCSGNDTLVTANYSRTGLFCFVMAIHVCLIVLGMLTRQIPLHLRSLKLRPF